MDRLCLTRWRRELRGLREEVRKLRMERHILEKAPPFLADAYHDWHALDETKRPDPT